MSADLRTALAQLADSLEALDTFDGRRYGFTLAAMARLDATHRAIGSAFGFHEEFPRPKQLADAIRTCIAKSNGD